MKKWILAVVALVVIGGASAVIILNQQKNSAASKTTQSSKALPPIKASSEVQADAVVVPVKSASLSMLASGVAEEIYVAEGQKVEAGQLLIKLNNSKQMASVAQAEAGLERAKAQLSEVLSGPRVQEIAAAKAAADASRAALQRVMEGPGAIELIELKAELEKADIELEQAALDQVLERDEVTGKQASQGAKTIYDSIKNGTFSSQNSIIRLRNAITTYNTIKKRLSELEKGPSKATIAGAKADLARAEAELELKRAKQTPEGVALAKADVASAQAVLTQAKAALADTELRAPFSGTVTQLSCKNGELVNPGTPLVILGDLSSWQVKTDNLTEMSVAKIKTGDPATVTIDALQGVKLPGKILHIKDFGENTQGDITYTATISLDKQDPRLRWNMTASVIFKARE